MASRVLTPQLTPRPSLRLKGLVINYYNDRGVWFLAKFRIRNTEFSVRILVQLLCEINDHANSNYFDFGPLSKGSKFWPSLSNEGRPKSKFDKFVITWLHTYASHGYIFQSVNCLNWCIIHFDPEVIHDSWTMR